MKIIFICSCLETGHDGIGDYTRLLAVELINQGHIIAIISLNDKYVSRKVISIQHVNNIGVPILRLPDIDQFNCAKEYINEFNPDWLSLQFVLFGYHSKGLPFGIIKKLNFLGKGRLWHIMFHELWVGMEINASEKHKLWGGAQRLLIKSLINMLKPLVIHTHTALYQQQIKKLGFSAQHLPLFGNIHKAYNQNEEIDFISRSKIEEAISLVIFGNLFPGAPVEDFANEVAEYITKNNVKIYMTFVGRCGNEQDKWVEKCKTAGMIVNILGEQSVNDISKTLRAASMGISTYPIALVEKSGSVAAMLEHGLPVICVQFPWQPKQFETLSIPTGIIPYVKGNLKAVFTDKYDLPLLSNHTTSIAYKFAAALLSSI